MVILGRRSDRLVEHVSGSTYTGLESRDVLLHSPDPGRDVRRTVGPRTPSSYDLPLRTHPGTDRPPVKYRDAEGVRVRENTLRLVGPPTAVLWTQTYDFFYPLRHRSHRSFQLLCHLSPRL